MSSSAHDGKREVANKHFFHEWLGIMRTTDRFLRAGLRRRIGPDGDINEAQRQWYANYMREHDAAVRQLVRNLHRVDEDSENAG
jgi:hypothetical protein